MSGTHLLDLGNALSMHINSTSIHYLIEELLAYFQSLVIIHDAAMDRRIQIALQNWCFDTLQVAPKWNNLPLWKLHSLV